MKALTIRDQLSGEQFRAAVAKALPKHLTPDRFIRVALTALTKTPKLAQCDQASFFSQLLTLSQLGLEPDGRRAHLIPFENRKRGVIECQLIIDYKGLAELAMRGGKVSSIHADVVCELDVFEYDTGQLKAHRINFRKPRGKVYAAYALARFTDGTEPKCEVMTIEEIEAIRARSRAKDAGPWVTDWNEMAKKTVFRRLSKWLPLSPEYRDALEHDADEIHAAPGQETPAVFDIQPALEDGLPKEEQDAPTTKEPEQSREAPQDQLAAAIISAGFTFDDFLRWGRESGNVPESLTCFNDIPEASAKRFLRSKAGLIKQLEQLKGEIPA